MPSFWNIEGSGLGSTGSCGAGEEFTMSDAMLELVVSVAPGKRTPLNEPTLGDSVHIYGV